MLDPLSPTLLALALCASPGSPASSERLYVDADATPGGQGASWDDALDDLQPALALARSDPAITEVWVAEGRYLPSDSGDPSMSFVVPDGLALLGGFDGTETLREERRPALHPTILDGDLLGDDAPGFLNYGDNSRTVVSLEFVGPATQLDGFTVRGGSGIGVLRVGGSGLRILRANPTLANLMVRENTTPAIDGGGGVYAIEAPGALRVTRCSFVDNFALEGAGLRLEAVEAVFEDCLFEANQGTDGGGIFAEASEVEVTRCTFQGNQVVSGAGISSEFGVLVVEDSAFLSNTGTGGTGISSFDGDLLVRRCHFERNRATTGAGILLGSDLDFRVARIESCTFVANRACSGGGIYAHTNETFRVEVLGCVFDRNRTPRGCGLGRGGTGLTVAGSAGSPHGTGFLDVVGCAFLHNRGGQFMATAQAEFAIRGTTIADATSNGVVPEPGIVTVDGTGRLENSIVWGVDPDQVQGGTNLTVAYSNVRNDGVLFPGPGNLHVDPAFADAANGDVHLAPGSPCIDAGNPAEGGVAADFEGDPRFLDGDRDGVVVLDMGADELTPLRLDVQGASQPGASLTIGVTGAPGLTSVLGVGSPGGLFWPHAGVLFLDPATARFRALGTSPTSRSLSVPAGVPLGVPWVLQAYAFDAIGRVLTNPVVLTF